jgi:tRNA-specific 2-thiouridylase
MAKTVFVGLSGGVDSSVAAARLIDTGYTVVGVFIKVWHPDWLVCNWEEERLDAMRVAAHLGIPFLTCDGEATYRDAVAAYFIESYRAGKTPNPDVMCNKEVKFGAFLDFARAHGADFIATGHYARKGGDEVLLRGIDKGKDQSYFLWSLSPEQLRYSLFPVGDTIKSDLRAEAKQRGLPTAQKKDSQGVCFLGHIDIPDFLSHYIDLTDGAVLDTDGNTIGEHRGAFVYTLGQRHGFTTKHTSSDSAPLYVVAKDIEHNTITVAPVPPTLSAADSFTIGTLVWRGAEPLAIGQEYDAQMRYRQTPFRAVVTAVTDTTVTLKPKTVTDLPASGQSCVLYNSDFCLGGGMML